jgi:aerobic C4-dicarboxylate transport protein
MLIPLVVFTTVVLGISQAGAMKDVGRIGLRAILYFEVVSTIALAIGLVVVSVLKPGVGVGFDPASADVTSISAYTTASQQLSTTEFILNIIPDSVVGAFARGDILQVLLFSILLGLVLLQIGAPVRPLIDFLELVSRALFAIIAVVMKLAPLGAFGAMSFTIGRYGVGALVALGKLMLGVYITCGFFIVVILGAITAVAGINLFRFLRYIREEIVIVLATCASELVLPRLMAKLENLGCAKPVVGLVVPTGYSFNLDGTSIYLTMAAIFIAQATGVDMTLGQELGLLAVAVLTSKGSAAIAGGGFVTLAATLAVFPSIPIAGLTLLLGVDRFMSEARSVTNLIGNAVATVVVARWENALDMDRLRATLSTGNLPQGEAVPAAAASAGYEAAGSFRSSSVRQ